MTSHSYQVCLFAGCEKKHRVHLKIRHANVSSDDEHPAESIYAYCYIHALTKVFSLATGPSELVAWHAEGDPIPPPPHTEIWPDVLDATESVADQPLTPYAHTVPHDEYYVSDPETCRKCGQDGVQFGGNVPVDEEGAGTGFFRCPYCRREWEVDFGDGDVEGTDR